EPFDAAVGKLVADLGGSVEVLGFGEPMHGGEDVLVLRNRLFQRLVAGHGYTAIAVESSFPRGRAVDEYVAGRGPTAYDAVAEAGFSHGFGRLAANRELVEWMRAYNADLSHPIPLRFYGFDSPTEMTGTDGPRQLLQFALDYLAAIDPEAGRARRERVEPLLGDDAAWENPAAMMDPAKSVGLSPAAAALRVETEDLVTELRVRRPELVAQSDVGRYLEVARHASAARQLLSYHAGLARASENRIADLLGLRDLMMADNLAYAAARERGRGGKVLTFAHNSHLKYGKAAWKLGPHALAWWPAGTHLRERLGPRYAAIGAAVGTSEANGIGPPEAGTLEARLTAAPGPARFIPTRRGGAVLPAGLADVPVRSGSTLNSTYFPLTVESLTDFDALVALDFTAYSRGGPPLQPRAR
ncbi:MAG: Erythromycin esterase, partial [Phycisphaerales bacterium]|nr:Erythromycin esterase [Phycisphaerales bacterium]